MEYSPNVVRRTTALAIAAVYLFVAIRRARLCGVRRVRISRRAASSGRRSAAPGRRAEFIVKDSRIRSKSNLPDWDKCARLYYWLSCAYSFSMAVKYSLVCLLDAGAVPSSYNYLDCFLLGRVSIDPRITGLAKYAACCVFYLHCSYQCTLLLRGSADLKLDCLEFLLMSPDEIVEFQRRHLEAAAAYKVTLLDADERHSTTVPSLTTKTSNHYLGSAAATSLRCSDILPEQRVFAYEHCSLLSYRNAVSSGAPQRALVDKLRPNRSVGAWRLFASIAVPLTLFSVGSFVLLCVPFWLIFAGPLVVTRPGFELNYRVCLEWISRQDNREDWRYIYDVPSNFSVRPELKQAFFLPPFRDWVQFNAYHTTRIICELAENLIFDIQTWAFCTLHLLPTSLIVTDIWYYCGQIRVKFDQLILDYHAAHNVLSTRPIIHIEPHLAQPQKHHLAPRSSGKFDRGPAATHYDYFDAEPRERRPACRRLLDLHQSLCLQEATTATTNRSPLASRDLDARSADLQAMVVDLFDLIKDCNAYVTSFVWPCLFIWFTYTLLCVSWLFLPAVAEEARTIESYLFLAVVSLYTLSVLGAYSTAQMACAHLYTSITTIVTLQELDIESRNRWMVILKHFSPMPLYRFALTKGFEISFMLTMKLTAWLFSVIFVVSTFSAYMQ